MANGRVITGFSKPYVALYSATGNVVTYSSGQALARGVDVSIELDEADNNPFYADNIIAEQDPSLFTSGTVTLTVDGLKDAANKLIYGLPTADEAGWTHYGIAQSVPYVGIGFVVRYQEDQAVTYVPVILRKCMFNEAGLEAATQEESIDWQTQELTARIMRDDTAEQDWKYLGTGVATEAAAESAIQAILASA